LPGLFDQATGAGGGAVTMTTTRWTHVRAEVAAP
jgi:hypothetical protein